RTKDLYRHIRSLTKTKSIVPKELISSSGCAVTGISNITNLLATQFASYFTLDDGCIPTIPSLPLPPFLSNVSFLPTDVFKALKHLSPSCSTGYDNIPQIIFRNCRSPIPSYHINNVALSQKSENAPQRDLGLQVVPSLLRTASIDTRISKAQTALFIMLRAVSRLSHLGLQALFERRVIFDLVFARRIMNGETILDRNKFFIFKPLRDRTNTFGVHIECTRSTPRFHCFPRRVAMLLNTLPPYIHRSPSMNVYKSRLRELDY
ncbi:hypothetical protein PFISCL1PPCAC_26281, partial [Pristionchus fissidentatus]